MARPQTKQQQRQHRPRTLAVAALAALALAVALPATARAARPWSPPPPPTEPSQHTGTRHHSGERNYYKKEEHSSTRSGGSSGRLGATGTDCPYGSNKYIARSTDRVVVWADTCEAKANNGCNSCNLYNLVVGRAGKGDTYIYTPNNSPPRTKIVPVKPMVGIESIVNGESSSSLWVQGLSDVNSIIAKPTNHPIAYANSPDARDQHQLHIHLGESGSNFYSCFKSILDAPPTPGKWSTLSSDKGPCGELAITKKYGVVMAATMTSATGIDAAIRDGFRNKRLPNAKTGDITSDDVLLRTGVLVQPSGKNFIVALVYNTDDHAVFGN